MNYEFKLHPEAVVVEYRTGDKILNRVVMDSQAFDDLMSCYYMSIVEPDNELLDAGRRKQYEYYAGEKI